MIEPTFTGQLRAGSLNTPLTRMTIYPDRVVFTFRTEKTLPRDQIEAVAPHRLPLVGAFFISGVRFQHRSRDFPPRLALQNWRGAAMLAVFEELGYPVERD